jgi:hypothetical protein
MINTVELNENELDGVSGGVGLVGPGVGLGNAINVLSNNAVAPVIAPQVGVAVAPHVGCDNLH